MSKSTRNAELLEKLDEYLEKMPPERLFEDIEGRYPEGLSLDEIDKKSGALAKK